MKKKVKEKKERSSADVEVAPVASVTNAEVGETSEGRMAKPSAISGIGTSTLPTSGVSSGAPDVTPSDTSEPEPTPETPAEETATTTSAE